VSAARKPKTRDALVAAAPSGLRRRLFPFTITSPAKGDDLMFDWLKKLFGAFDRQQAAADRAATGIEGIAEDLETVRDALHARLTGTSPAIADDTSSGTGSRRPKLAVRSSS
jgi:hypothetical protein